MRRRRPGLPTLLRPPSSRVARGEKRAPGALGAAEMRNAKKQRAAGTAAQRLGDLDRMAPAGQDDVRPMVSRWRIARQNRMIIGWWIGDWWNYGEHRYGERQAIVESGPGRAIRPAEIVGSSPIGLNCPAGGTASASNTMPRSPPSRRRMP